MEHNNAIPVIPYGLRHEETIAQIATALHLLDSFSTDIFEKVRSSLEKHKQSLKQLQRRTDLINNKVNMLSGNNIATTVYADPAFPSINNDDFEKTLLFEFQNKRHLEPIKISSKFVPYTSQKNTNKLQFFHVKTENLPKDNTYENVKGLGNLPQDLNSVSSLLLFNSAADLYKEYVMDDPLEKSLTNQYIAQDENEKGKIVIAAAPNSMINNNFTQNSDYFSCFYTPTYQEVPSIDLPQDLPDLPGIAGNLRFSHEIEKFVTPSSAIFNAKNVTTKSSDINNSESHTTNVDIFRSESKSDDFGTLSKEVPLSIDLFSTTKSDNMLTVSANTTTTVPSLSSTITKKEEIIIPIKNNSPVAIPPPPPLPPPISEILNSENPNKDSLVQTKKMKEEVSLNVHANLMEAIRKAGGKDKAQLRPITDMKNPGVEENSSSSFMSDLYKKLALRRKGISGQGQEKNQKRGSILDQMSAMISSSPPDESDVDDEDSNDLDWDD